MEHYFFLSKAREVQSRDNFADSYQHSNSKGLHYWLIIITMFTMFWKQISALYCCGYQFISESYQGSIFNALFAWWRYELNAYFNTKFNEQEEKLTKTFNNNIDDLYNVQIQNEVSKWCKGTESENKNAKKQVEELKKLSIENRSKKRNWSSMVGAFAYVSTVFLL